jgi:hypothetical protein
MSQSCKLRWALCACVVVLAAALASVAAVATPVASTPASLLDKAERTRSTNRVEFAVLLRQLEQETGQLSQAQQLYLEYLEAWQKSYAGDYQAALEKLRVVAAGSDVTLQFRARSTMVDMLAIVGRYEDAFTLLDEISRQMPQIPDRAARIQALGAAAQMYNMAGQYGLAARYADQLIAESLAPSGACKGSYYKFDALYRIGKTPAIGDALKSAIDVCVKAHEVLFANGLRTLLADDEIQHGHWGDALKLLQASYAEVQGTRYPPVIALFNAKLAQAYWSAGNALLAKQYALAVVDGGLKGEHTEAEADAYWLLYQADKQAGDTGSAQLDHQQYAAADTGYLKSLNAKALAYQAARQHASQKQAESDGADAQANARKPALLSTQAFDNKRLNLGWLYATLPFAGMLCIAWAAYRVRRKTVSTRRSGAQPRAGEA